MKRSLWGEFTEASDKRQEVSAVDIILPSQKAEKLKELKKITDSVEQKVIKLKMKNPHVTQTIEVMNQTEMVQTLIDTYANKSGYSNYLPNPCQIMPQISFPPENSAELQMKDKFAKPFWFIPPIQTDFTRGVPQTFPKVNAEIARAAMRKTICGLLRVAGFNDATHSALLLLVDSVDEFIKNLLLHTKDVQINHNQERENTMDILTLERGYFALTNSSLTSIHNYFKNDILARNRKEIAEFKDVYSEYDKMMKESQNLQKASFKEEEFINFLEFSGTLSNSQQTQSDLGSASLISYIDPANESGSRTGAYNEIFRAEVMETDGGHDEQQVQYTLRPSSLE